MAKRRPMSRRKSKRLFTNTALNVHPKNLKAAPMRGGFRI